MLDRRGSVATKVTNMTGQHHRPITARDADPARGRFAVDRGWQVLLNDLRVSPQDVLRRARLALDLFSRPSPSLSADEYFRFWDALAGLLGESAIPLRVVEAISVEAFSPPIFAWFCSAGLNKALQRLSQYKPLIGPLRLDITKSARQTAVALGGLLENRQPPSAFLITELLFLVQIARLALREQIVPTSVVMSADPLDKIRLEKFLGASIHRGDENRVTFSADDAAKPFLTANANMWSFFEPELRMLLADLKTESSFGERVRVCLMEILASGRYGMADVARRLGVSTRTLQRRLSEEGASFQRVLNDLRDDLARNYLSNSHCSSAEISFLLGYNDPNSFIRAFHARTGQTPEVARSHLRKL